jgi:outer membrane biosynthesis protein TonB
LKLKLSEPGIAVSGGIHLLALILLLVSFASKPEPLDPMQETVPIETVSDTEFNEVMKGEKTAAEVKPDAATTAQSAPTPEVSQTPPTPEPQQQTPPPPPPLPPEPVKQDVPTPP